MSAERGQRKTMTGKVVSNRMNKTIVVAVTRRIKNRTYKKYMNSRTKYKVHDEQNECNIGDMVVIRESRPLSAEKRWRLVEIKTRAVI